MNESEYKVYGYRWVILLTLIPIFAMTQVFWLTFAPITDMAKNYYNVSPLSIAFLSMSYMIVYIIMALPASILVDTKGFRISIGVGAIIIAVFGIIRGIFATNFIIVVIAQLGAAVGQPFLINSTTKVAARWFKPNERATASGIATMAGYIGMIIALVVTPILAENYGIKKMLIIYGIAAILSALIFIVFSKEHPLTPAGQYDELVNKLNYKDVKRMIKKKDYMYLLICVLIVLGIFNAVMTWVEDILKPRGISTVQSGIVGGVLVIVGLIGAVILPIISDKLRKRRQLLMWPMLASIPGFIGFTFASNFPILLVSSAIMGFFIMGMGPIAFQYGAEVAYPVPEGISFGILMLMGQISGITFIYLMDKFRTGTSGDMTVSMLIFIALILVSFFFALKLKESPLIAAISKKSEEKIQGKRTDKM